MEEKKTCQKKKKKKICVLRRVQFLLGQGCAKREFSDETEGCRKLIYNERGVPAGTGESWRVGAGSVCVCVGGCSAVNL